MGKGIKQQIREFDEMGNVTTLVNENTFLTLVDEVVKNIVAPANITFWRGNNIYRIINGDTYIFSHVDENGDDVWYPCSILFDK
jgi:hypothetical protein